MKAKATYDPEADAIGIGIGISFASDGASYLASQEVAPGLTLDFDEAGNVIGVGMLGVRRFLADRVIAFDTPATEAWAGE